MGTGYDVAAYVWPAYTGDEPRTRMFWPEGMGEWQSVKNAVPKFEGHDWPRRPRWGYVNEADPYVMAMQIDAALDHGVNTFIYDWYWYDGRPFLEGCLDDGFLRARNRGDMRFYLMWANHDVNHTWDIRLSHDQDDVIWRGAVRRDEFERMGARWIERYFALPNYYRIDGKPALMIYDTHNLIRGLGGVAEARRALDDLRAAAVAAGLPGLHLQMTMWSESAMNLSGVDGMRDLSACDLVGALGYDSITHYQFAHFVNIDRPYPELLEDVRREWERIEGRMGVPYFPHISMGWDNNPRFQGFRRGVVRDATPANIEIGLRMAKAYADAHPDQPGLVTLNSWNEWTETSYLQPDDLHGYGYLEAVRRVFGAR